MNVYWVWDRLDDDWGIVVVAETARKAKAMAFREWPEEAPRWIELWIELRVRLCERNVPHAKGVYVEPDPEWTLEWYCNREFAKCDCRACREETDNEH